MRPRPRTAVGSSPLTRGKLLAIEPLEVSRRLIPAHAGKTDVPGVGESGDSAHPRSRGENLIGAPVVLRAGGSSPLTRGKHPSFFLVWLRGRLIPAHAGKTPSSWTVTRCSGAHPRSRGENTKKADRSKIHRGSSPLTRGKRNGLIVVAVVLRLIPAHAGKT